MFNCFTNLIWQANSPFPSSGQCLRCGICLQDKRDDRQNCSVALCLVIFCTADDIEVLWCATSRRQDQIPTDPIRVGGDLISPATSVRDLGIYLDSDASMRTHVSKTVSNCFAALRQIRSIRQCVSRFPGR